MTISALPSPTTAAKISDLNTLITSINAELATLASSITTNQTAISTMGTRVKTLEDKPVPVDLTPRLKALEDAPGPALPPDLSDRVAALEQTIANLRTPPAVAAGDPMMSVIPHTPADPTKLELVYDKATLYLGDMELHALRIAENKWRLVAQLNYITISQIVWTYDETVTGTPDEVYAHASARLVELAKLKVSHDAAHKRVREMSEGKK